MAAGKRKSCKNKRALMNFSRYNGNPLARSHGKKVRLEPEKSIGRAPVQGFVTWVLKKRKRAMKSCRRHQGRPFSHGEYLMFTLPDYSNFVKREKFFYERKLLAGLGRGAAGKLAWHNKLLFNTHDLNLLIAPVYVINGQVGPRRDSAHSEFQRLKRISDRAIERLNRRRLALGIPLIVTMAQVQARQRAKLKFKTVAEALADSGALRPFLFSTKPPFREKSKLKEALTKGLTDAGYTGKVSYRVTDADWAPNWIVRVKAPGRTGYQLFSMVAIAAEVFQLMRQREQAKQQAKQSAKKPVAKPLAAGPATSQTPPVPAPAPIITPPPAPVTLEKPTVPEIIIPNVPSPVRQAPPVQPPSTPTVSPAPPAPLTSLVIIAQMLHRSNTSRSPIRDVEDLQQRLHLSGYAFQFTDDGQLHFTDAHGQQLRVEADAFARLCQRQILLKTLASAGDILSPVQPPEFESYNARSKYRDTARWNVPPYGEFWNRVHDVCTNITTAHSLQKHITATAKTIGDKKRVGQIRSRLKQNGVDPWEVFVLLQAHCGSAAHLGDWMLGKHVEESLEFMEIQDLLIPTGYEAPSNQVGQNPGLGR